MMYTINSMAGLAKSSKDWAYAICDRGYRMVHLQGGDLRIV